jgi:hypothetical protein
VRPEAGEVAAQPAREGEALPVLAVAVRHGLPAGVAAASPARRAAEAARHALPAETVEVSRARVAAEAVQCVPEAVAGSRPAGSAAAVWPAG